MREEYCALLLSALVFAEGASSLQAQAQAQETAYDNEWMGRTIRVGLRYRFK